MSSPIDRPGRHLEAEARRAQPELDEADLVQMRIVEAAEGPTAVPAAELERLTEEVVRGTLDGVRR